MARGSESTRTEHRPSGLHKWAQVVLVYLAGLPRTGVFLGALALVLAGLFLPGLVGAALLLLMILSFGVLLGVTWPQLAASRRVMQVVVLVLLAVIMIGKLR